MKRTDIVDAFVTRLRTIRKAAGYNTDIGRNVARDRVEPLAEEESSMIDVVAGSWEATDEGHKIRRWMNVSVAFVASGNSAVGDVADITEDVIKAVYTDVTFGGSVILTQEVGGSADKDIAEELFAWGEVDFRVLYDTAEGEI